MYLSYCFFYTGLACFLFPISICCFLSFFLSHVFGILYCMPQSYFLRFFTYFSFFFLCFSLSRVQTFIQIYDYVNTTYILHFLFLLYLLPTFIFSLSHTWNQYILYITHLYLLSTTFLYTTKHSSTPYNFSLTLLPIPNSLLSSSLFLLSRSLCLSESSFPGLPHYLCSPAYQTDSEDLTRDLQD